MLELNGRNYQEAVEKLRSSGRLRINPSLKNIKGFLKDAGLKKNFKVIQVSGTNGKTSTSCFLSAFLTSAGIRAGLFVSPHVVHYGERISADGKSLSPEEFGQLFLDFFERYERLINSWELTEFEILTAFAVHYFNSIGVEIAVFETGLGGKFDAVSALGADFGLLTGVHYDHTDLLGETLKEIAYQKLYPFAGKDVYITETALTETIDEVAKELGVNLVRVEFKHISATYGVDLSAYEFVTSGKKYKVKLQLKGEKYAENWALSREAAKRITGDINTEACKDAKVPARFQRAVIEGVEVVVDGSHNPQAIGLLLDTFKKVYGNRNFSVICGFLKNKDYRAMLSLLKNSGAQKVVAVKIHSVPERELDPAAFVSEDLEYYNSSFSAFESLRDISDAVVVTGSFALCGEFIIEIADIYPIEAFGYHKSGKFVYY